ncbi:hypothetical protein XI01_18230 [Bradyrhizobium sp. CCBAU 21360]|nr:hypothetical protein [Bradyrhizobium sp. CCBAU 21360]
MQMLAQNEASSRIPVSQLHAGNFVSKRRQLLGSRKELNCALLAGLGLLAASPIGYQVILNFGGNFYPEPLIATVLTVFALTQPAAWRAVLRSLSSPSTATLFVGLTLLAAEGLIFTDGDVIAVYADFRCILILVAALQLATSRMVQVRYYAINALFLIVLFSVIGHALFYLLRGAPGPGESIKAVYPTIGLIFLAAVAQRRRWFTLHAVVIGLSVFVAITSFYRSNMIVAALLALAFLPALARRMHAPRPSLSNLGFVCASILCAVFLWIYFPDISDKIFGFLSADERRYGQTIGKLNNLFEFFRTGEVGGGDDSRVEYLNFIGNHFEAFLLPSGLGYRAIIGNWGPIWSSTKMNNLGANSIDGFHLYMLAHFGLFLSIALIMQPAIRLARYTAQISSSFDAVPQLIYVLALLLSMVISGNTFSIVSSAVAFGACLGYLGSKDPATNGG